MLMRAPPTPNSSSQRSSSSVGACVEVRHEGHQSAPTTNEQTEGRALNVCSVGAATSDVSILPSFGIH